VGVFSLNPIYAGNIAAACEATNQEVAQKQKEVIKDDNEELQRKKAASRITAWQSRERKRIEMEVLQERKAELTRRNADLRSENEQLRLLISNLKPIVQNPGAPRPLVPSQQFSENSLRQAESGMSGMAAPIRGMVGVASSSSTDQPHKSTQPPIYTHPFAFADNQSLYGFPSATATANAAQSQSFTNFFQQSQGQQQTFSHQIPPFGLSLADLASLQQRVQMQQRPESQDNSFSAGGFSFHGTSTPTPLNLINDTVSPLARQQSTISAQESTAMDSNRYPIPPHPSQPEDTRGAPPLDITSLLLPQGNFRVDIPLIRAVPKRKESENIKDKSQEKTKDDV
jgi:bZIP transcription factor